MEEKKEKRLDSNFPDWFIIDKEGLSSLDYFLRREFMNKTVKIFIEEEEKE